MRWVLPLPLAAALTALVCTACSTERDAGAPSPRRSPAGSVTKVPDPSEASDLIGRDLLISLAQARNYHHKARLYMTDGNLAAATAQVRQILTLAFPAGAPEADDVRNDARALLAKLLVSQGQLDEAARTVDDGIAGSSRDSFFVANLYTVQGEIHEARAAALDAAGAPSRTAASDERHAAIAAYDRSIQINARLQKKLMEER